MPLAETKLSDVLMVNDDGEVKPRRDWREFFGSVFGGEASRMRPAKSYRSHDEFLAALERSKRLEIEFHQDTTEVTLRVLELGAK